VAQASRIRCVPKRDEPMWRCQLALDLYPDEPINDRGARHELSRTQAGGVILPPYQSLAVP
jgi:hypothetical protein